LNKIEPVNPFYLENTIKNYPQDFGILVGLVLLFVVLKKSRVRETKHLSTDADSSTDTIVWWTKNTPKPDFFEKRKKSPKTQKLKNV
jgi:hypothetical protein